MPTIHVDGRAYPVEPGSNLLHACLSRGLDLPYFCWHPALGSVGACRQCAVKQFKDEHDTRGRIVMACMTAAKDGTRIAIDDPQAREFRRTIIEWLMANHPHDCPICDEGGECHLQDMTVMTGHVRRRYRFEKRTFRNQDLGPCLNHEMNRCITCYRCVRFYQDYAGGTDLHALASRNRVYFGRHADGTLESEFSGNLAEVCPTGVFTDKTLGSHYTRKWDQQSAPSLCVHCGAGCNTLPAERYGLLRRIVNRYNGEVNGYFLCDRGRFGYEFVNLAQRLRRPQVRAGDTWHTPSPVELAAHLERLLTAGPLVGIGSPRASLESNFALRELVGPERFFAGLAPHEHHLAELLLAIMGGPVPAASLREAEQADAVLVLGEDVPNTAPRLALALRQATRGAAYAAAAALGVARWQDASVRDATPGVRSPLHLLTPTPTRLDDVATTTRHDTPDNIARLGLAIAHVLDDSAPVPADLAAPGPAAAIAADLAGAANPLVVCGLGCADAGVLRAAANIALALHRRGARVRIALVAPECNTVGALLLGGRPLDEAAATLAQGAGALVVLENDLYRRLPPAQADALLGAAPVVVLDHLINPTTGQATLRLPAATFAEGSGTLVSSEGRAQRFFQVVSDADDDIRAGWRWLAAMARAAGRPHPGDHLDALTAACAAALPALARIVAAAPGADLRLLGQRVPRQPHRYSGRTAQLADRSVHEPKPPHDPDSPLAFTMEGYPNPPPPPLIPRFWAPGWNSQQAVNKFQAEVAGPLSGGDPGVRLFAPGPPGPWFAPAAAAPPPRDGAWRLLPLHEVFGSEELSRLAPAVAARAPAPYLALSPGAAATLGLAAGAPVTVRLDDGRAFTLPLRLLDALPPRCVGLPLGLGPLLGIALPATVELDGGDTP